MSTSAVPTQARARVDAAAAALSLRSSVVGAFSGTVGLALKVAFLAVVNAIAVWAGVILAGDGKWVALAVLVGATLALDLVYAAPKRVIPAKFLVPGTIFLLAFQVAPIFYNVNVGFTNWSTGHILTKREAIDRIEANSLGPPPDGNAYVMAPARDADGALVLVLVDDRSGEAFVGTRDGLEPLAAGAVTLDELGVITTAEGYTLVRGQALLALDQQLQGYTVPTEGAAAIRPEGLEAALELEPTLRYDPGADTFTRIEGGAVYRDNGRGSFVTAGGEEIEPGWRTSVGFENFSRILDDPLIRQPFLRAFIWTFAFASLTVLFSFALGLFLAIALDVPGLRLKRTYRALLVIPWAMPAFLALLVWGGLLNDEFGVVNRLLPVDVPWLFDANWAKVSVLLVSVWLTFPYFLLVTTGALQSIPGELVEAARVDGAGPWQVFRRITLPLLLVAVAPLLIASFAFNFNNFNIIFLLTGGGPPAEDQSVAGGTDILITYSYKLAFESGKGLDYGLASAISIVIFFIVGTISAAGFWKTKALENVQ